MALIQDIAQKLQDDGVGTRGTDIFLGQDPDNADIPTNVIIIYEESGLAPSVDLPEQRPTFQVYVRNSSYLTGRAKIEAVYDSLHQTLGETVGGTYFYNIFAQGAPGHIGRDGHGRNEFTLNFRAHTR